MFRLRQSLTGDPISFEAAGSSILFGAPQLDSTEDEVIRARTFPGADLPSSLGSSSGGVQRSPVVPSRLGQLDAPLA